MIPSVNILTDTVLYCQYFLLKIKDLLKKLKKLYQFTVLWSRSWLNHKAERYRLHCLTVNATEKKTFTKKQWYFLLKVIDRVNLIY